MIPGLEAPSSTGFDFMDAMQGLNIAGRDLPYLRDYLPEASDEQTMAFLNNMNKNHLGDLLNPEEQRWKGDLYDSSKVYNKLGDATGIESLQNPLVQLGLDLATPVDNITSPSSALALDKSRQALVGAAKAPYAMYKNMKTPTSSAAAKPVAGATKTLFNSAKSASPALQKLKALANKAQTGAKLGGRILSAPVRKINALAAVEQLGRGMHALGSEDARNATHDRVKDSTMGQAVADSFLGQGGANIGTLARDGGDFAADYNADVLMGNVSPKQWVNDYVAGSEYAGQEFANSNMGRQVFGLPSADEEAYLDHLYKLNSGSAEERRLRRQQTFEALKAQGALPKGMDTHHGAPFRQHYNKLMADVWDDRKDAAAPLVMGGKMQDWYEKSYGDYDDQTARSIGMSEASAMTEDLRKRVGPYSEYFMDAMAGSKGNTSMLPRTMQDIAQYRKYTGKISPGVDYFKNTKAKNFNDILAEAKQKYDYNNKIQQPAAAAFQQPQQPPVQKQMEMAKKNMNKRMPAPVGG
jgi:hypothetical protein